jgi:hypothetical protein
MHAGKHLLIALSRKGWGETSLGAEVARQLRDAGGDVTFMAHSSGLPALAGSGFEVQEVLDHMVPLFDLLLETRLTEGHFDSIILSDYLTTDYTLRLYGVEPERLLRHDVPIIALDTWEYPVTGATIDIFGLGAWRTGTWIEKVKHRLVPSPMGHLNAQGAYCGLPQRAALPTSVRRHIRQNLGLSDAQRAVLFCTAGWQHHVKDPQGQRIAEALPELLWAYLSQVDSAVHLIHVGPEPISVPLAGERYLWMPSLAPESFERLLGSVDLMVSANISASTIGRAIASGLPTIVTQNSFHAETVDEVESAVRGPMSRTLREWLEAVVPLHPFSLWPLGHWQFLKPLLCDNPYRQAIDVVELLHETVFVETCRRLLYDSASRAAMAHRQNTYADQVRKLPTAAQLIESYLH